MEKISYERRVYESVEDKSLSWSISTKSTEKNKNSFFKYPIKIMHTYILKLSK